MFKPHAVVLWKMEGYMSRVLFKNILGYCVENENYFCAAMQHEVIKMMKFVSATEGLHDF